MLGKIFEKILFNSIFEYLQENSLLCGNQSGFQLSHSCEYKLLSIVHDIYASLDCNPPKDAQGIFLKFLTEHGIKDSSTKCNVLV